VDAAIELDLDSIVEIYLYEIATGAPRFVIYTTTIIQELHLKLKKMYLSLIAFPDEHMPHNI